MELLKNTWDFIQNEILGMNWLNRLISGALNACGMDTSGKNRRQRFVLSL